MTFTGDTGAVAVSSEEFAMTGSGGVPGHECLYARTKLDFFPRKDLLRYTVTAPEASSQTSQTVRFVLAAGCFWACSFFSLTVRECRYRVCECLVAGLLMAG